MSKNQVLPEGVPGSLQRGIEYSPFGFTHPGPIALTFGWVQTQISHLQCQVAQALC